MILFIFWGKHSDGSMEDGQVGKGESSTCVSVPVPMPLSTGTLLGCLCAPSAHSFFGARHSTSN